MPHKLLPMDRNLCHHHWVALWKQCFAELQRFCACEELWELHVDAIPVLPAQLSFMTVKSQRKDVLSLSVPQAWYLSLACQAAPGHARPLLAVLNDERGNSKETNEIESWVCLDFPFHSQHLKSSQSFSHRQRKCYCFAGAFELF